MTETLTPRREVTIQATHGANAMPMQIMEGKTLKDLLPLLRPALNLPMKRGKLDCDVQVNGEPANMDTILRAGDRLEFEENAGVKGVH